MHRDNGTKKVKDNLTSPLSLCYNVRFFSINPQIVSIETEIQTETQIEIETQTESEIQTNVRKGFLWREKDFYVKNPITVSQ